MRDIKVPKASLVFEKSMTCAGCNTSFVAESDDLEYDGFKKAGTYFFDGSADRAGYNYRFFVCCPANCGKLIFVDNNDVPPLLAVQLKRKQRS